jgi:hypothetical protein
MYASIFLFANARASKQKYSKEKMNIFVKNVSLFLQVNRQPFMHP